MQAVLYKISQSGTQLWGSNGIVLGGGLAPYPAVLSTGEVIVAWNETASNTLNLQKITTGGTTGMGYADLDHGRYIHYDPRTGDRQQLREIHHGISETRHRYFHHPVCADVRQRGHGALFRPADLQPDHQRGPVLFHRRIRRYDLFRLLRLLGQPLQFFSSEDQSRTGPFPGA